MTKRRRPGASRKLVEARFWGQPAHPVGSFDGSADEAATVGEDEGQGSPSGSTAPLSLAKVRIRPTPDPGALIRSLGPPPLAVDPALAERHLTAVYEEAVRAATALVAANGLLATDDPGPETS